MGKLIEYKGYHATVEYSDEDEALIGKVFGLADTIVFDGESLQEINMAFHEAIDDYLAYCEKVGKVPEKEFKGSFNIRISPEMHRMAALEAEKRGISLNQLISDAIENYIKCDGKPHQVIEMQLIQETMKTMQRGADRVNIEALLYSDVKQRTYNLGAGRGVLNA